MSPRIADGKHFLDIVIESGGLNGHIICMAKPETDKDAACRMAPDAPECFVKYAWSNLATDMLATPHHSIHEIHVWASPLPIIYEGEGNGENYEDWVIPDIEHPTYQKAVAAARKVTLTPVKEYETLLDDVDKMISQHAEWRFDHGAQEQAQGTREALNTFRARRDALRRGEYAE